MFQVEIEKAINEMLDYLHKHVTDRRIVEIPAPFVTGSIRDQDITFWIYPESAALQIGPRHLAFGRTDYTLVELGCKFLDELRNAVQGRDTEPNGEGNADPPNN